LPLLFWCIDAICKSSKPGLGLFISVDALALWQNGVTSIMAAEQQQVQ
jgi:hypothetical protein